MNNYYRPKDQVSITDLQCVHVHVYIVSVTDSCECHEGTGEERWLPVMSEMSACSAAHDQGSCDLAL